MNRQEDTMSEVEIVKSVIEKELNNPQRGGRVHKLSIMDRLALRVGSICCYNKLLDALQKQGVVEWNGVVGPDGYGDGEKNVLEGAKLYYNGAIRSLTGNGIYSVSKDGWISRRLKQKGAFAAD